jgi:C_GCAxxG_C_C family probable redox protein
MTKKEKELVEKVGKSAYKNEKKYPGCTQAVLGAFREVLGDKIITDEVFKAGCGMAGGVGNTGSTCGALCGSVMVISLFTGRDLQTWGEGKKMFDTFQLSQKLIDHFKEKYWSQDCNGIQEKIFGRAYNTNFPDELKAFEEAGGHTEKCPNVVKEAASKTMELLVESKLINADDYI